jgi:hypothetical protein
MSVPIGVELGVVSRSQPGIAAEALLARTSEDGGARRWATVGVGQVGGMERIG